jgi:hypothetical protein
MLEPSRLTGAELALDVPGDESRTMERAVKRCVMVVAITVSLWACGKRADEPQSATTATDTLTRRQKDSLISTMPIPGAGAVGRALDAQDASRARAAALDSILNGR